MRRSLRERLKIYNREDHQGETLEESGGHGTQGEGWTLERTDLPEI